MSVATKTETVSDLAAPVSRETPAASADPALAALLGQRVAVMLQFPRGKSIARGELVAVGENTLTLRAVGGKFAGRETLLAWSFVVSIQAVDQVLESERVF